MTRDTEADERRRENYALYDCLVKSQNAKDTDGFLACFTDDVVFEAPAYSKGGAPIAEGREAMGRMFEVLKEKFTTLGYRVNRVIPAVDPDLVIVEVKGDNEVAGSGKHYCNDYLFLVGCREGKIASILEYSNPQVYDEAVG